MDCKLEFTTPFNEASHDPIINIIIDLTKPILASGNHIGAINLNGGIRIND